MKLLGGIMIFSAIAFSGFYSGEIYRKRLLSIAKAENLIKKIVLLLKKENMALPEMFSILSAEDEITGDFLKKAEENRFCRIGEAAEESGFCKIDSVNSVLAEAFSVLGKYSADEQISEIEISRKKINDIYEKSKEPLLKKAGLIKKCGVLLGAFVLILIL